MNFRQSLKPIFTSLSPNTEKDDILLALKMIPRIILRGTTQNRTQNYAENLEEEFKRYLGVEYAFAFNSGRSAFLAILSSLLKKENSSSVALAKGDEILLQAFTCNAAVNPIIWSGLKPVFVDIDEQTLNINPEDLERKISAKSRVVMVQHTFGSPADLDKILEICEKHNLILIEDCAHSLGATYRSKKIGTFGRVAFFSFGRDKIISSIYGGMAATNDPSLAKKLRQAQGKFGYPSYCWIFQQLLHPILTNFLIIPLYGFFGIGRWVLIGFQKLKILSKAVHKKEKRGERPTYIPKRMPNALAILALNQFKKLEKFISHQRQIANFYDGNLSNLGFLLPQRSPERVYMRYPVLMRNHNTDEILKRGRKKKIFLDDGWRKTPIVPPDTSQPKMGYISGTCPVAEKVAKNILNLPTHINISQQKARRIANFLKEIL